MPNQFYCEVKRAGGFHEYIYICIYWAWQIFLKTKKRVNQYKIGGN